MAYLCQKDEPEMSCIITTDEVRRLAQDAGLSLAETKNLIGLWQESTGKGIEEMPSVAELTRFRKDIREGNAPLAQGDMPVTSGALAGMRASTRQDRANMLATVFTMEADRALEETKEGLRNRIGREGDSVERERLQRELEGYTDGNGRKKIINDVTVDGMIGRVRERLERYVQQPLSRRLEQEKAYVKRNMDTTGMTEAEVEDLVRRRVEYQEAEIRRVLDDNSLFNGLAVYAKRVIAGREAASVPASRRPFNEDWMEERGTRSALGDMDADVRELLSNLARRDKDGNVETDDLGYARMEDMAHVHTVLLGATRGIRSSEEIDGLLKRLAKRYAWVETIRERLADDDQLKARFYNHFHRESERYWAQETERSPQGKTRVKTISLNAPEGVDRLMERWQEVAGSGKEGTIYGKDGKARAKEGRRAALDMEGALGKPDTEVDTQELGRLLRLAGIDTPVDGMDREAAKDILGKLGVIFYAARQGKMSFGEYRSAYRAIAARLRDVEADESESGVWRGGRERMTSVRPTPFGDLFSRLTDTDQGRFDNFINDAYKRFTTFFINNRWLNSWIKELVNRPAMRKGVMVKTVTDADRKEPRRWSRADTLRVLVHEFFSDKGKDGGMRWGWYLSPVTPDAAGAVFVRFRRYASGDEVDRFGNGRGYRSLIKERLHGLFISEYNRIRLVERRRTLIAQGLARPVRGLDDIGDRFIYLQYLNDYRTGDGMTVEEKLDEMKANGASGGVAAFIDRLVEESFDQGFEADYSRWEREGILPEEVDGVTDVEERKEKLREYWWNSRLATANMLQLMVTDPAYFQDAAARGTCLSTMLRPGRKLDVNARFAGQAVDRKEERSVMVKEDVVRSAVYEEISAALDKQVEKGNIRKAEADRIRRRYARLAASHKTGYRTLESYRRMLIMAGRWTDDMEGAYRSYQAGTLEASDHRVIFRPVRYTVVSYAAVPNGINGGYLRVPMMEERVDFPLLAPRSATLRGMARFMDTHGVDVIRTEGVAVTGAQGAVSLGDAVSEADVMRMLEEGTGVNKGMAVADESLRVTPYEDYYIQEAEVDEAQLDTTLPEGTQVWKLVRSLARPDTRLTVDGKTMDGDAWREEYDGLMTESLMAAYDELDRLMGDPDRLMKEITDAMAGSVEYPIDMVVGMTLPLHDPVTARWTQSLLTGVVRERVTRRHTRGAVLERAEGPGLSDGLRVVFNEDGGIKYIECYVPAFSDSLRNIVDERTGLADASRLPEDLRRAIGYTMPAWRQGAVIPLYIKGFLPAQDGTRIILPAEASTILGDSSRHVFLSLSEFTEEEYDTDAARHDFDALSAEGVRSFEDVDEKWGVNKWLWEGEEWTFGNWLDATRERYRLSGGKRLRRVAYDDTKTATGNTPEARANRLFDLTWAMLTSPDASVGLLGGAGTEAVTAAADAVAKLRGEDTEGSLGALDTEGYANQGAMGATRDSLTGAMTDHLTSHRTLSGTGLAIKEEARFSLYGDTRSSLHETRDKDGRDVGANIAGFLEAVAADADGSMTSRLCLNPLTVDTAMTLLRMGYTPRQVITFLSQPVIRDMADAYGSGRYGYDARGAISAVIEDYSTRIEGGFDTAAVEDVDFTQEEYEAFIRDGQDMTKASQAFLRAQVAIAAKFIRMRDVASDLGRSIKGIRGDTSRGWAGPDIAATIRREEEAERAAGILAGRDSLIEGVPGLISPDMMGSVGNDADALRARTLGAPVAPVQAFHTFGIESVSRLIGKRFPIAGNAMRAVTRGIWERAAWRGPLTRARMNGIMSDAYVYMLSDSMEGMTRERTRDYLINTFPSEFMALMAKKPAIAANALVRRIVLRDGALTFTGTLDTRAAETYTAAWEELLESDDMEVRQAALTLFRYAFTRTGFMPRSDSLTSLTPAAVRMDTPRYVERLNMLSDLAKSDTEDMRDVPETLARFIDQYMLNHLDSVSSRVYGRNVKLFEGREGLMDEVEISVTPSKAERMADMVRGMDEAVDDYTGEKTLTCAFYDYLAVTGKDGDTAYYRLDREKTADGMRAYYERVERLGKDGVALEYDSNVDAREMVTVVGDDVAALVEGADMADALVDSVDTTREEAGRRRPRRTGASTAVEDRVADGASFESLDSFDSNDDFKDDEGKPICK